MQYTTIRHIYDTLGKIEPHAPALLGQLPAVQENPLVHANVRFVLWNEIAQLLHSPSASNHQMEDKERALWLLHFEFHSQNRIWWAYFQDRVELETCLTAITQACPCLTFQSSETCPHGLRVCSAFYASRSTRQQHADACQPEIASLRDKQLFPLAPFACDYLTSFLKGLGDAGPCAQCHNPASLPPAGNLPATQA